MPAKTVYSFHPRTRAYLGIDLADESPLEPGVFLMPAHATEIEPPATLSGQVARFIYGAWVIESAPSAPVMTPLCIARAHAFERLAAYRLQLMRCCYARERVLAEFIAGLPDDLSVLDAFDPAAVWCE